MSLWYQKNVYVSCAEEFWNCRKYGNTGTELYRWRSDWWYYCFCEDYRYIYGDNKSNSRTLLDTMSKGVKEKRATKKALSINHKQYLYLSSGTPAWFRSISVTSQNGISCFARLPSFLLIILDCSVYDFADKAVKL